MITLAAFYFIASGIAIQGVDPMPRGFKDRTLAFCLGWLAIAVLVLQKAAAKE